MTTTSNTEIQDLKEFISDRFNQLDRKIDTVKAELKQEIPEVKAELKQEITEVNLNLCKRLAMSEVILKLLMLD